MYRANPDSRGKWMATIAGFWTYVSVSIPEYSLSECNVPVLYTGGADKSLARPERKQATATEGFDVYISYL